ncbi:unnamed protein product [Sphenostylis stenocarpa]|uniref:Uncharacterized protein n=1 Tax=Sphenostylis stenocarpa TaxID=92480 RepID=A0AA86SZE7_9FABA|nr:unnamed protein product [Sphenostylis stenocarpa]
MGPALECHSILIQSFGDLCEVLNAAELYLRREETISASDIGFFTQNEKGAKCVGVRIIEE